MLAQSNFTSIAFETFIRMITKKANELTTNTANLFVITGADMDFDPFYLLTSEYGTIFR